MRHRAFRVCCFMLSVACGVGLGYHPGARQAESSEPPRIGEAAQASQLPPTLSQILSIPADAIRDATVVAQVLPSDDKIIGAAAAPVSDGPSIKLRVDELVLTARMEADAGNYDTALGLLQEAKALDPDNGVIDLYIQQINEQKAAANELSLEEERLADILEAAERFEREGELYRARNAYAEALKLDPDSEEIAEALERVDAAIAAAEAEGESPGETTEVAQQPVDVEAAEQPAGDGAELARLSSEADAAIDAGDYGRAADLYLQILAIDPDNRGARRGLAFIDEQRDSPAPREVIAVDPGGEVPATEPVTAEDAPERERRRGFFFWRRDREEQREVGPEPVVVEAETAPAVVGPAETDVDLFATPADEPDPRDWRPTDPLVTTPVDPGVVPVTEAPAVVDVDVEPDFAPVGVQPDLTPVEVGPAVAAGPNVTLLLEQARELYDAGELEAARELWAEVLAVDPDNIEAQTYLENTEEEYEALLADRERQLRGESLAEAQRELLNSPLTIQTDRPTPLSEFMRLVSFSTAEELEYYIAEGAETDIFANFVDRPLHEVLDVILLPKGLTWSINESNLITIELDLKHRAFSLSPGQVVKVRALLDSGHLQNAIWGQATPPAPGVEITLDERQRVLLVVGSDTHIQKVEDLVSEIERIDQPELDIAFYKIREEDGPKIKSLINAIVTADQGTPFEVERRIFIDGNDLIVRDTPENIAKIEELLLDNDFIEGLREETLEIANFSLVPRDFEDQNTDQVLVFTSRVVEMIKTLLYSRTGVEQAEREGRRLWYDPSTLQLTIIDTPTNIGRVGNYIASLPELRQRRQQRVIFLEHAVAEVITGELQALLDLRRDGVGAQGGEQVVIRLRRGEIFTFRDYRIRLLRVEEGDPDDRFDDEAQLNIISGTSSSDVTVRELNTVFFEDIEITAEEIQPSGRQGADGDTGRTGEGTARLLLRFVPEEFQEEDIEDEELLAGLLEEPEPITIQPFGPLNALIIRFENPALFNDTLDLIRELDRPTPQVEVETRFVQVNEARAREFSADFNLANWFNDTDLNTDLWQFDARFAQNQDEGQSVFDFPLESPAAANLLKGQTVLDLVLGDGIPGLSFQLRLLEAEGVVNIVNGPKVTMLDGIEGEFRIDRIGPSESTLVAFDGEEGVEIEELEDFFSEGGGNLVNEDASTFEPRLTSVILLVTPEITSPKSIIFDVTAEILDLDNFAGNVLSTSVSPVVTIDEIDTVLPQIRRASPGVVAITNRGNVMRTRKLINTTARIPDGGTMVLGGWTGERTVESHSGVPVLRNMPYIGKFLFSRNARTTDRTTLLIFLSGHLID